ncbi:MAG: hypothetical protein IH614_02935 [Desulfuromonadales bacterium]|nr:hypothetical protein [Desulfuromonadales bacterium]
MTAGKPIIAAVSEEWERRCRRCGRCCFEKIDYQGEIYYTQTPCNRLDPTTRLCTVYGQRHRLRPDCVPLTPQIIAAGILPADCPYVQGLGGYRPPHLFPPDEELP